jgi:hypothetical protein
MLQIRMNAMSAMTSEFCACQRLMFFSPSISIPVRFIVTTAQELQIKRVMKTSVSIRPQPVFSSPFQTASRAGDFTSHAAARAASLDQTPFIELMLHRDKLEEALKIAKIENDAFEASRTFSRTPAGENLG